jgi:hypothetical protein
LGVTLPKRVGSGRRSRFLGFVFEKKQTLKELCFRPSRKKHYANKKMLLNTAFKKATFKSTCFFLPINLTLAENMQ